jgi:hypothetical protein
MPSERPDHVRSEGVERTPLVGSIGYTGSYCERSNEIIDVSVVSVLEARGPE